MAGALTVFVIQQIMQLADVVFDKAVVADLVAPRLDAVLFTLLSQCGLIQMQQLARLVNGVELIQFLIVDVGDIEHELALLIVSYNWQPSETQLTVFHATLSSCWFIHSKTTHCSRSCRAVQTGFRHVFPQKTEKTALTFDEAVLLDTAQENRCKRCRFLLYSVKALPCQR